MNLSGLNNVFEVIADTLQVSIEVICANAPYYLKLYGKYCIVTALPHNILAAIFFGFLVGCLVFSFLHDKNNDKNRLKRILCFVIPIILSLLLFVGTPLMQYTISPEIYGVEQVLKMIE